MIESIIYESAIFMPHTLGIEFKIIFNLRPYYSDAKFRVRNGYKVPQNGTSVYGGVLHDIGFKSWY